MKKYCFTFLAVFLFSITLFAQKHDKPLLDEDKPHKMLEVIKIWKIMEFLDLDEEQTIAFFPKLKKIEKHKRESFKERRKLLGKLHKQLEQEKSDNSIKRTIDEVLKFDKDAKEKEEQLQEELLLVLTIKQQAKLLIFQERFEEEIRKIIRELRKGKKKGAAPEKRF
ncbi:MAG: hypothetical protein E3J78_00340 [Candidatus Cloacimonadota bacterium]|nr:MAG: hypothetical protein E3J78_00340 [Candidatus Cloacimonadota bacterium]